MKSIKISGKNSDKEVLISDEDYDALKNTKWYINSSGYVTDGKTYMHQIILPKIKGKEIEHKDRNRLNNQINNIRYATRSQNHANRKKSENSLYKGVRLKIDRFRNKPWQATIRKDYKNYYLGYYSTAQEAAIAYNKKVIELYGEFARINTF